jgi:hypothetical protein
MCHAFITNHKLMPPPIILLNSSNEEKENVIEWFHEVF